MTAERVPQGLVPLQRNRSQELYFQVEFRLTSQRVNGQLVREFQVMVRLCMLFGLLFVTFFPKLALAQNGKDSSATPSEVFEQRIMPIFKSPQPASCVQCHLAGVDLKDYILPSHEQTFASLRDQGLVDLERPANSKILTLIRMGEQDLDEGARRIHEKTRRTEYEAFAAWIEACCADPKMRNLPKLSEEAIAGPDRPTEVIRHARKNRIVDSFVRNVWSQRMRCFPCHTPHELDETNPKLKGAIERHREFMSKYGDQFGDRMNIFRETPQLTLQALIHKSRKTPAGRLPLLNLEQPTKSLLVLKPTSKLPQRNLQGEFEEPTYAEPISHMGGLKMHVDDLAYKAFVTWIQDYARVAGDSYKSVDELPLDNWYASKSVVMIREVPDSWEAGACVQLFVHSWNEQRADWNTEPVAFTQALVSPIRNAAGALMLLRSTSDVGSTLDPENAKLPPGRYLLKVHLDRQNRLRDDPTMLLPAEDLVGEAEVDAQWEEGFPKAEKVAGKLFEKR